MHDTSRRDLKPRSRVVFVGDNLNVMRRLPDQTVDLVYLDPPFRSEKVYAPTRGSLAHKIAPNENQPAFNDVWKNQIPSTKSRRRLVNRKPAISKILAAIRLLNGHGAEAYAVTLGERLNEAKRLLKTSGNLILHCDPAMSHPLKMILDAIFGTKNFRNEIIWRYGKMSNANRSMPKRHDTLFLYSKSDHYAFTPVKAEDSEYKNRFRKLLRNNQVLYKDVKHSKDRLITRRIAKKIRESGKLPKPDEPIFDFNVEFKAQGDVIYAPIVKGNAKERTGYPTQKPLALLRPLIAAASKPHDIVLDPYCGSASTCIAAESLNRKWIGIDISIAAHTLAKTRMKTELGLNPELVTRIDIDDPDAATSEQTPSAND